MQKNTSVYIPKPCHEDWNTMTPVQQGKFCSACSKQVVDFSLMNDNQILDYLSKHSGKTCGRFYADQLQRPLIETKKQKKKSWWMALMMPLLFLFEKSEAQETRVLDNTTYSMQGKDINRVLTGKVSVCGLQDPSNAITGLVAKNIYKDFKIVGKVVDENYKPVPFATIIEKGTKNGTLTDAVGNFSIIVSGNQYEICLQSSAVGYETTEQKIGIQQDTATIIMKNEPAMLSGDVVVTVGAVSVCHKVKTVDTLYSTAKKLFGKAMFKLYPNPVENNGILNIQFRLAGDYDLQVFDNQSELIFTEEIVAKNGNYICVVQLHSIPAAGVYYFRMVNRQTKKSYTEKIIVQ